MEAPDGLEIAGECFAAACVQRATSCSVALSVSSLICSDFMFRSPVRGFGSLTCGRGTKGPRSKENGNRRIRGNQGAGADGNGLDRSPRVASRTSPAPRMPRQRASTQGKSVTFGVTRGCIAVGSPVSSITWLIAP